VCLASWLGPPIGPATTDLAEIYALQVALGNGLEPPTGNAGEAESIYFAESLGAIFATDDNAAYLLAASRRTLGLGRVVDSVGILLATVQAELMTPDDAAQVCSDIRRAGRRLRRTHPFPVEPGYFNLKSK